MQKKKRQAVLESNSAGAEQLLVGSAFVLPYEVRTHTVSTLSLVMAVWKHSAASQGLLKSRVLVNGLILAYDQHWGWVAPLLFKHQYMV